MNPLIQSSLHGCAHLILACLLLLPGWVYAGSENETAGSAADDSVSPCPLIDTVQIDIEGSGKQSAFYVGIARQLITVPAGQPLDEAALARSLQALELSKRFRLIHVDTSPAPGGQTLIFTLTPFLYVKEIQIHGEYPLFERDVLNQMTIHPGAPFRETDFAGYAKAISTLYQREGYIDPTVDLSHQTDEENGTAVVVVRIDKGPHYTLGNLTLRGNHGVSAAAIKWRLQVWRASLVKGIGRFSEFRLKRDVNNLLRYYRERGFADASIAYEIKAPDEANRVDVILSIREGKRYRVTIDGNQRFFSLTLRKDVVLFTVGNRANTGVRKSVRNMKNRYRNAGFLDTRIETEVRDLKEASRDVRQLRFIIHEGVQTLVEKVDIRGNRALADPAITAQMLTRPPTTFHDGALVPETLEKDVRAVRMLYMNRGFQESTVDADMAFNEDRSRATVTVTIEEGPRTRVRSISFEGSTVLSEAEMRRVLVHRVGEPLRDPILETEKQAITTLMAERGYIHANVRTAVRLNEDHTWADIVFDVQSGVQVTLGGIFIAGNLRTEEKVIRRELGIEPGSPLSLQTLQEGQRWLRDLNIFHTVNYRTIGLKEKDETVNLFVDVEEIKPFYVQLSGGYESDTGFFGRAMAGDRNLFGLNKDLWASAEISQIGYRLETRLLEPRLFRTRTRASIGVFNEEVKDFNQPFGTRTTGGSLSFNREWGQHLNTTLSFGLERRTRFEVENDPGLEFDEERRTIFVATPFVRYDTRDSFIRPTSGSYTSLSVDISKGLENQVDDFVRYVVDTRYFFTPIRRLTLACMARIGQVNSYSTGEQVPEDQLFFLGGIRDVRGYAQNLLRFDSVGNPVGGRTALVGSLEARFDLGMNVELTTFFDVGSVQDALVEEGSERFRPTAGLGLRYITPIGPMGVLYGRKLDREPEESPDQFHISIGYSF